MAAIRMPFGKHRGQYLDDVPGDYLCWVLHNCTRINPVLRQAIERHLGLVPQSALGADLSSLRSDVLAAIAAWQRKRALSSHPDRGGSTESMQVVNDLSDELREVVGRAFESVGGVT